jgi:hypothetical protein
MMVELEEAPEIILHGFDLFRDVVAPLDHHIVERYKEIFLESVLEFKMQS